ncbi:unnamed protein product [Peniophora sp. CBMAI 1063]|nr:unnamed protein product [Peniophora sp. CBMAI 1063]
MSLTSSVSCTLLFSITQVEPVRADPSGGMDRVADLAEITTRIRMTINKKAELRRAIARDKSAEFKTVNGVEAERVLQKVDVTPRANFRFDFFELEIPETLGNLTKLRDGIDLEKVVVITGYGEVAPWGSSQPEFFRDYDPKHNIFHQENELLHGLEPLEVTGDEAERFKREHADRCYIRVGEGGQCRQTAGQLPTGWSVGRYGIPDDMIPRIDRVSLWALASMAEAPKKSGITDPYKLYEHVHAPEVGIGPGMGGLYGDDVQGPPRRDGGAGVFSHSLLLATR